MSARYRCTMDQLLARSAECPETGCWLWLGAVDANGYARLTLRVPGRKQPVRVGVHRLAYEVFGDTTIGEGLTIDHTCYEITCINPAHLREVTPSWNSRESYQRNPAMKRKRKTA
jgi:hypothetical protein